jgi:hypothetical protein
VTEQEELKALIATLAKAGHKYYFTRTGKHMFRRWDQYRICETLDDVRNRARLLGVNTKCVN